MSSAASLSAPLMRATLQFRCSDDSPPGAWRSAAPAAGVSGADAFLCHLSRSIAAALEVLAASADAAQVQLRSTREAAPAEYKAHCDELDEGVVSAETTKRVALERELCAADAALERLRAARGAAAEAASSLDDDQLLERHAELTARLDAAEAQLLALPTSVIEPPYVGLVVDASALLAGSPVFGRVIAPHAVTSADLTLEGAPLYLRPGNTVRLRLTLQCLSHASQSAEELGASLCAAAAATHIEALLQPEGAAPPRPLPALVSVDAPERCITIVLAIPPTAPVGSSIIFGPLTVSGHPMAGLPGGALRVGAPGPADLSPEHAAWLHSQLPPSGSSSPGAWEEVYRATTHGFGAAAFHTRCDGRARLLVLVRAREGGWLFGGFTAFGFSPQERFIADPAAFLFSLTNSLGRPEKLESLRAGKDLYYGPVDAAYFYGLVVVSDADARGGSWTQAGVAYAASESAGAHPMAQGFQSGWHAAEVVAWAV